MNYLKSLQFILLVSIALGASSANAEGTCRNIENFSRPTAFDPALAAMVWDFAQARKADKKLNEASSKHSWTECSAGTQWRESGSGEYVCVASQQGLFSNKMKEVHPSRVARVYAKTDCGFIAINGRGDHAFEIQRNGSVYLADGCWVKNISISFGDAQLNASTSLTFTLDELEWISSYDDAARFVAHAPVDCFSEKTDLLRKWWWTERQSDKAYWEFIEKNYPLYGSNTTFDDPSNMTKTFADKAYNQQSPAVSTDVNKTLRQNADAIYLPTNKSEFFPASTTNIAI